MNSPFELIVKSIPLFIQGVSITIQVFILASILSFILGLIFGTLLCKRLRIPIVSSIAEGTTFISRAVPFFVQLLIVYFVLPDLFSFTIQPFTASVIALGFCSSGYVAQFVRGNINAIPIAHWEAAFSLGYTMRQTLFHIIIPQTFRLALPAINNELDSLLKSTAIISSIGMLDLTRIGMNLVSREMEPVPIYLFIAFLYLCMSAILNFITKNLEKRFPYVKY